MKKHPVKLGTVPARRNSVDAVVAEPVEDTRPRTTSFVSFRYSFTEISTSGGKTRVKSRKTRLEDGKLVSEAIDGELECGVYERLAGQAEQAFVANTGMLLRSLSWFLPFSKK